MEHFTQSHPYLPTTVRFVHFHDFQSLDRIDVRHVLMLCRNSKLKCFTRLHVDASHHLEETPPLQTNNSNSKTEQHNIHDSHTKKKSIMSEATPRITAPYLEQFSHQTVRILGKVRQIRGEQATIDAGGQVSVFLNRVSLMNQPSAREWIHRLSFVERIDDSNATHANSRSTRTHTSNSTTR